MERKDLQTILLNYKKLVISSSLIERYCLLSQFNSIPKLSYPNLKNIYRFRFYTFDPANLLLKELNNPKIEINSKGLFLSLNTNNFLKELEKIYHIKLIDIEIEEKIKAIKTLQNQLHHLKKADDLSNISSLMKKDYIIFREANIKTYLTRYKRSYAEHVLLQQYLRNQRDNLTYLLECLKNNFYSIRACNNNLEIIDKDKLALALAYQIIKQNQKQPSQSTLTYLKEYLQLNEPLLKQAYSFQVKLTSPLNISETKMFSIRTIYDYLQTKTTSSIQTTPSIQKIIPNSTPTEQYDYNFLETSSNVAEILSNYYQLGMSSPNDHHQKELLERKIAYYSCQPVTKIKIGKNSFAGYIGFCLENGHVILEKFFDDMKKGIIAIDQAIYLTDEENFEQVTRLSKLDCMEAIKKGKIKAKRMNHVGDWEKRINNYNNN